MSVFPKVCHDSEVRDEGKARRKKFETLFKAKLRCTVPANQEFRTRSLKNQLRPVLLEFRLLSSVNTNNVAEIKRLLALGVSANTTDVQKRSALHIAVTRGYKEIVKLLLQYGADPNKRDMLQNTPLHLAACSHHFSIISLLLDAGADVNSLDMHGRHPLQLAKSKLQILHKSWMQGHIEMIKLKSEVREVINLMISVRNAKERSRNNQSSINNSEIMKLTISNLENMRLTITSDKENNMEEQMSKLLDGIQNFQIG